MKRAAFALILAAAAAGSALAADYATSFEAPAWTTSQTDPFLSNGWNRPSGSASQFGVTTAAALDGTQSVRFLQSTASSTNYSVDSPTYGTSNKYLSASVSVFIVGDNTANTATQAGREIGLGTFGSSATSGIYLRRTSNTSNDLSVIIQRQNSFTYTDTGVVLTNALNTWVNLGITFDIANKSIIGTVDGTPFTVNSATYNPGSFDGVAVAQLYSHGTSSAKGLAYYDSFQQTNTPVPEPASIAALGLGAVALLKRRRK